MTVAFDDDRIVLYAGTEQVGDWARDECSIVENGAGFAIRAEGDELSFTPYRPEEFKRSLGAARDPQLPEPPEGASESKLENPVARVAATGPHYVPPETDVPPPQALTLALFYTLAGITALLAMWALWSILT